MTRVVLGLLTIFLASCVSPTKAIQEKRDFLEQCVVLMMMNKLPEEKAGKFCEERWNDLEGRPIFSKSVLPRLRRVYDKTVKRAAETKDS